MSENKNHNTSTATIITNCTGGTAAAASTPPAAATASTGASSSSPPASSSSSPSDVVAVKEEQGKKNSTKPPKRNFTTEEDVMISRAFVACTLDPISGADQKAGTFWASVYKKFTALCERECEVYVLDNARNDSNIENRFKRIIQKAAMKWTAALKAVPIKSGEQEKDHFARVNEKYKDDCGKYFQFLECMPHLQKLPKFDPNLKGGAAGNKNNKKRTKDDATTTSDSIVAPAAGSSSSTVFSNMSTNLKRPMGNKKAKKKHALKLEKEASKLKASASRENYLKEMSQSIKSLSYSYNNNEEKFFFMQMWKTCVESGQSERAEQYLRKLESLEQQEHNNHKNNKENSSASNNATDSSSSGSNREAPTGVGNILGDDIDSLGSPTTPRLQTQEQQLSNTTAPVSEIEVIGTTTNEN